MRILNIERKELEKISEELENKRIILSKIAGKGNIIKKIFFVQAQIEKTLNTQSGELVKISLERIQKFKSFIHKAHCSIPVKSYLNPYLNPFR